MCWPGCAPGSAPPFFASSKRCQKTTLLSTCPLRCAAGQPAMLARGACRRTRYALRATLKQLRQVSSRAGVLRRQPAPRPALLGTARRGGTVQAIAALGLVRARLLPGQAQRWPVSGCSPPVAAPGAGAFGVSVGVAAHASCLTCRGCLNGRRGRAVKFCGTPKRPDPGLPRSSNVGVADLGRVLWPPFLHEQEGGRPLGETRPATSKKSCQRPTRKRWNAKINCNLTPINSTIHN